MVCMCSGGDLSQKLLRRYLHRAYHMHFTVYDRHTDKKRSGASPEDYESQHLTLLGLSAVRLQVIVCNNKTCQTQMLTHTIEKKLKQYNNYSVYPFHNTTNSIRPMNANTPIIMIAANAIGIHIGANTHNHDQVITPVSFNMINRIPRNPVIPIPPDLVVLFDIATPYVLHAFT